MQIPQSGFRFAVALLLGALAGSAAAFDDQSQYLNIKASGYSPDWTLDIPAHGNRLTLSFDGTTTTYSYPALGPSLHTAALTTVYRVPNDKHQLTIFVKGIACRDVRTGKSHEVTVLLSYDGKGYTGCGDVLNR